ncbi:unnamed protein product, partial [marine sediment metagenome]
FHPTEIVSDKVSAVLPFVKGILLHITYAQPFSKKSFIKTIFLKIFLT